MTNPTPMLDIVTEALGIPLGSLLLRVEQTSFGCAVYFCAPGVPSGSPTREWFVSRDELAKLPWKHRAQFLPAGAHLAEEARTAREDRERREQRVPDESVREKCLAAGLPEGLADKFAEGPPNEGEKRARAEGLAIAEELEKLLRSNVVWDDMLALSIAHVLPNLYLAERATAIAVLAHQLGGFEWSVIPVPKRRAGSPTRRTQTDQPTLEDAAVDAAVTLGLGYLEGRALERITVACATETKYFVTKAKILREAAADLIRAAEAHEARGRAINAEAEGAF